MTWKESSEVLGVAERVVEVVARVGVTVEDASLFEVPSDDEEPPATLSDLLVEYVRASSSFVEVWAATGTTYTPFLS